MIPPLYPPIAHVQSEKEPELSFLGDLAFYRGAIILIGADPSWIKGISTELAARLERIKIYSNRLPEKTLSSLGIARQGVYLLDPKGRVLLEFHGGLPADFDESLNQIGWFSRPELLKRFIQKNPDRIDVRWELFNTALTALGREQSEMAISECASALQGLLNQPSWAAVPNVFREPRIIPKVDLDPHNPLSELAASRWEEVMALVKNSPEHSPTWQIAGFLANWHVGHPRLYKKILEIVPGPSDEVDTLTWPNSNAINQAETQLRRERDWRGMTEFAESRLSLISDQQSSFNPETANEWSGTIIVTNNKPVKLTRREKLTGAVGRWLLMAFEAALEEEREGAARVIADRLIQESNTESQVKAMHLAESHKATSLVSMFKRYLSH